MRRAWPLLLFAGACTCRRSFSYSYGMDASVLTTPSVATTAAGPGTEDAGVGVMPPAPVHKGGTSSSCARDDSTGRPFPVSSLPSDRPAAEMSKELDTFNDLCGDTWCEGSFELFFDGMRCDATSGKCHIDMRWYAKPSKGPPPPDVARIEASGPGFHGRVVGLGTFAKCTPPCTKGDITPCAAVDVRCELDSWKGLPSDTATLSACINAMEDAIRKRFPE